MNVRAAAVEICEVEGGECTMGKITAIEWFRRSNNGGSSLEDQPRLGPPSTMNIEALSARGCGAATTNKHSQIGG